MMTPKEYADTKLEQMLKRATTISEQIVCLKQLDPDWGARCEQAVMTILNENIRIAWEAEYTTGKKGRA
jgi:hypothetical protein